MEYFKSKGILSIEIMPEKNTLFYNIDVNGNPVSLTLPTDSVIGKSAYENGSWDKDKIKYFTRCAKEFEKILLVDVGANIGLFSRQCIAAIENLDTIFVYEPHIANFNLLRRNLENSAIDIKLINAALSEHDGQEQFYEDTRNCGNYSLVKGAMWDNPSHNLSFVNVIDAVNEQKKWQKLNLPIFYKSDTQGFDEVIATRYDTEFWDYVACASFELWRIEKPDIDLDKFVIMLDQFPYKSFQHSNKLVTNKDVLDYMHGKDGEHEDLLCWKIK